MGEYLEINFICNDRNYYYYFLMLWELKSCVVWCIFCNINEYFFCYLIFIFWKLEEKIWVKMKYWLVIFKGKVFSFG